jgi:L-asparaginase / beta-aspartyl-peptidase
LDTPFSLAVHGGAGVISAAAMRPEAEAGYHAGLRTALQAGYAVLSQGGTALDAVTRAVMALEDDPLFNAGRGAVFTSAGRHEMDAAIMDGRSRRAGAVASVCGPRNPVTAARLVMEQSEHVLLVGEGALAFCRAQGLALADADYFRTERRWESLQRELARRAAGASTDAATRHGTVGAVARDARGDLAAATSTGGMTAKLPGRVGDSPVFGAGTWAENGACAVSATGHGEFFIRYGVAHEIAARMRLAGQSLAQAAEAVIAELGRAGGEGGVVAVDASGAVAMPFNSEGMYRGEIGPDGVARTEIY